MTTMSMSVVQLESLSFLDSLDSPLAALVLQLSNLALFCSACFIVRKSRMLRITRDTHGIRWTNKTLNLKIYCIVIVIVNNRQALRGHVGMEASLGEGIKIK